jgi:hypothetical protein
MDSEWRCTRCGKLLGVIEDARLHIRFSRGHEYLVGLPATGVCRSCQTLNEIVGATAPQGARRLASDAARR